MKLPHVKICIIPSDMITHNNGGLSKPIFFSLNIILIKIAVFNLNLNKKKIKWNTFLIFIDIKPKVRIIQWFAAQINFLVILCLIGV